MGTAWLCGCGHRWELHDIYEPGDRRELCCVKGCNQNGCPGKDWADNATSTMEEQ